MSTMTIADVAAHEAGSYVRATPRPPKPARTVLKRFPASSVYRACAEGAAYPGCTS